MQLESGQKTPKQLNRHLSKHCLPLAKYFSSISRVGFLGETFPYDPGSFFAKK